MLRLSYVCWFCGADLAICDCADCGVAARQVIPLVFDDGVDEADLADMVGCLTERDSDD